MLDVVIGGWVWLWERGVVGGVVVLLVELLACEFEVVAVRLAVGWRAC